MLPVVLVSSCSLDVSNKLNSMIGADMRGQKGMVNFFSVLLKSLFRFFVFLVFLVPLCLGIWCNKSTQSILPSYISLRQNETTSTFARYYFVSTILPSSCQSTVFERKSRTLLPFAQQPSIRPTSAISYHTAPSI